MKPALAEDSGEFREREFPMTNADFERVKSLAFSLTGITLSDHKKNMVYSRLTRRLRKLRLANFSLYLDIVEENATSENTEFINAITTNLTAFFRENHHFEFLTSQAIPRLIREKLSSKRLRIWSAGCSTGEEPYSLAMVFKNFAQLSNWDVKILATDLDTNVVAKAKEGIYSVERADTIPEQYRKFIQIDREQEQVRIKDSVRDLITFKQLNLLHSWPIKGPFDIIFCRNVVIYFNVDTQIKLFDRYADILTSNGELFIGHSENLHNISTRFKSLGRTIYERTS